MAAHQAPRPWDSPGKKTGVGCHFLLQCMKMKSESEVAQSCPALSDPVDCSPPGSSVHGIFQARVLEWGAIAFSYVLVKIFGFDFFLGHGLVFLIVQEIHYLFYQRYNICCRVCVYMLKAIFKPQI